MGGGIGFIVAKYLLGLGGFSSVLTSIVTGVGSAMMAGGRPPKPPVDKWGRAYYL
jgi:hypothetical protein